MQYMLWPVSVTSRSSIKTNELTELVLAAYLYSVISITVTFSVLESE